MKQAFYLVAALFILCMAISAQTAFAQDSGATTDQKTMTIEEIRALDKGAPVSLQATLSKGLGAGKVALEDPTGAIRAKIDKSLWPDGDKPKDGTLITVYGTLYKRGNQVEIEVTKVEVNK